MKEHSGSSLCHWREKKLTSFVVRNREERSPTQHNQPNIYHLGRAIQFFLDGDEMGWGGSFGDCFLFVPWIQCFVFHSTPYSGLRD
mmetsp:Transcript_1602/g.1701  ORF Transcript_1602/g.1701 Transcript_1602/m.1701 type:complete len:86 (-) Transcript_1602:166-423(-)